jgi:hypothetical protein
MTTAEISAQPIPLWDNDLAVGSKELAYEFHGDQLYDKKPVPELGGVQRTYIDGHLQPAVRIVEKWGYGPEYVAGTWLHDSIEDVEEVTPELLIARRMPLIVVRGIQAVTKDPEKDYDDPRVFREYLEEIAADPLGPVIKTADSFVNLSNTALMYPEKSTEKFLQHQRRYLDTITFLRRAMPPIPVDTAEDYVPVARVAGIPRQREEPAA